MKLAEIAKKLIARFGEDRSPKGFDALSSFIFRFDIPPSEHLDVLARADTEIRMFEVKADTLLELVETVEERCSGDCNACRLESLCDAVIEDPCPQPPKIHYEDREFIAEADEQLEKLMGEEQ